VRVIQGAAAARAMLLERASPDAIELPAAVREAIRRIFGTELDAQAVVDRILRDVRSGGDEAVRRYNQDIDGIAEGVPLEVPHGELEKAHRKLDRGLVQALEQAAVRIRGFHERQLQHSMRSFEYEGIGQKVRPIERAGMYVPGTAVVYPSTVLMTAIPARVAGVQELFMTTPAARDGTVSALKLAAAQIAGVDRVFRAGGAQGIAALAYGTESIPAVQKICGPGGIFVSLAKKAVYGRVGIDGVFGPSETVVLADETADPEFVLGDMLAAAEHDELATALLFTTSKQLAEAVSSRLAAAAGRLERAEVATAGLRANGAVILFDSVAEALALANEFAPEHLCLHVTNADEVMDGVRNAGCVFVGPLSVESIGDYTAGPSHVMPTGGSAVYASPLGVQDFLKATSIVRLARELVEEIGPGAAAIARGEGLTGHAASIELRLGRKKE